MGGGSADANVIPGSAAAQAGDTVGCVCSMIPERNLLDLVHAPSKLTPAELDDVRTRLDAAALVFKVRILSSELRERDRASGAKKTT